MKVYALSIYGFWSNHEPELRTELFTDIAKAQDAFLAVVGGFPTWEDMASYMVRFANGELSEMDKVYKPRWDEGSPLACGIDLVGGGVDVWWYDGTLDSESAHLTEITI